MGSLWRGHNSLHFLLRLLCSSCQTTSTYSPPGDCVHSVGVGFSCSPMGSSRWTILARGAFWCVCECKQLAGLRAWRLHGFFQQRRPRLQSIFTPVVIGRWRAVLFGGAVASLWQFERYAKRRWRQYLGFPHPVRGKHHVWMVDRSGLGIAILCLLPTSSSILGIGCWSHPLLVLCWEGGHHFRHFQTTSTGTDFASVMDCSAFLGVLPCKVWRENLSAAGCIDAGFWYRVLYPVWICAVSLLEPNIALWTHCVHWKDLLLHLLVACSCPCSLSMGGPVWSSGNSRTLHARGPRIDSRWRPRRTGGQLLQDPAVKGYKLGRCP